MPPASNHNIKVGRDIGKIPVKLLRSCELRKVNDIHCTIYIFPWRKPESTAGVCHFDVESGTFKGKFGTLMWPSGTLMFTFNTQHSRSKGGVRGEKHA